jgi:hypothetical protein
MSNSVVKKTVTLTKIFRSVTCMFRATRHAARDFACGREESITTPAARNAARSFFFINRRGRRVDARCTPTLPVFGRWHAVCVAGSSGSIPMHASALATAHHFRGHACRPHFRNLDERMA